ncbi:MAG: F0F1 ATP synthase subunit A, partial [Pseudomonadota bacterium]
MAGTLIDGLTDLMRGLLINPAYIEGPLDQFKIKQLIPIPVSGQPIDLSITNSAVWMFIGIGVAILLLTIATRRLQLVPGGMQSVGEMTYEFISNMLRDATGDEGRAFFPFIFTLFIFVFLGNMLGLLPTLPGTPEGLKVFTTTSHIIVTFTLAMMSVGLVVIVGFIKNGFGFLKLFVPSGVPWWLYPVIVPIEIISFLS